MGTRTAISTSMMPKISSGEGKRAHIAPPTSRHCRSRTRPGAGDQGRQHERRHHGGVHDPFGKAHDLGLGVRGVGCSGRPARCARPAGPKIARQQEGAEAVQLALVASLALAVKKSTMMLPRRSLAQRHEQRDGRAGGDAGQLEGADDGVADGVAPDQAGAGHQGDAVSSTPARMAQSFASVSRSAQAVLLVVLDCRPAPCGGP